jgi:FkbH-like protein
MISSFNELKKNNKKDFTGLAPVRIAVLSDSASQFFCQALKGYGYTQSLAFDIWEADYDQVLQTAIDESSPLYERKPDYVIVFESSRKLLAKFYNQSAEGKRLFAENYMQHVTTVTAQINSRIKTNIIWLNYAEINDTVFGNFANKTSNSFSYQLRLLNLKLMEWAQQQKNFNVCDLLALQSQYGNTQLYDEKVYINTDNVYALDFLPVLAKSITDIMLSYSGKFKKCLILDLDNTTWGGIIGDDGMEGIQIGDLGIGKAFTKFQQWVLQLKQRGIILAVCSKNTESIAKEPFEKHPDMQLKLDDIAIFVANWNNKVDNIRYIQSVLNIGFDSMVFLDDNPFEREMVKKGVPEITVPELPEDPAEYLSYLYTLNLFETASFTEEDTKRNEQYREEAGRMQLQQSFANEDEFLESLDMKAVVAPVDNFSLPRVAQLTQRSNQFNLRTIRYTEEEMKAVAQDENKFTLTIRLADKFGDYGLISALIAEKKSGGVLFIDTWIMSCRVLKRGVEHFALQQLVTLAKENSCATLAGEYIPTAKNGLVKEHYQNLGFESKDGLWLLDVNNYSGKKTHIKKQEG